jgi:NDP-sugar pyrophosphorylase family protein
MKLIVLAAGKGTRFLPITESLPKALIEIKGKKLIDIVLAPFLHTSISSLVIVVNETTGQQIMRHIGDSYNSLPVSYAIQTNRHPSGTLGALLSAYPYIAIDTELFAVCNCDDVFAASDIQKTLDRNTVGMGINYTIRHSGYRSVQIDSIKNTILSVDETIESESMHTGYFLNGLYILNRDFFRLDAVCNKDSEYSIPHTLFQHFLYQWQQVNSPQDIPDVIDFLGNL